MKVQFLRQMAQDVSSMVLALRRKVNIKVRQPLQTIMVPVVDAHLQESIEAVKNLILNEVNVKELKFVDNAAGILVKRIKPDFKKLGPRYGKIMKSLAAAIQSMSQENIMAFEAAGTFTLNVEGLDATVELADVEIISEDIPGWLVANEGRLTVALDITVTEDLRKEGLARVSRTCVRAMVMILRIRLLLRFFLPMKWMKRLKSIMNI